MRYFGKTEDDKDIATKEYVDKSMKENIPINKKEMLKMMIPVGEIKEFGTDINPNIDIPDWVDVGWTWEPYAEGLTTVGKKEGDSLFGSVGGEVGSRDAIVVSHSHTTPAHSHTIGGGSCTASSAGNHRHVIYAKAYDRGSGSVQTTTPQNSSSDNNRNSAYAGAHTHPVPAHSHTVSGGSGTSGSTGSTGTDKNIQPSIVVSKWIRVA